MLRSMRAHAKWVFYILAVSFIAWLAIGQVMSILGPRGNVVLRVNGTEFQYTEFQQRVQAAIEQIRQQTGSASLTREDEEQVRDQVINQMIQKALLEQEYKRLGIRVSDDEIREAVRTSPPPFVLRDPQYQTDGQFDSRKWEQALANADPQSLAALEAEYRERIPESKLQEYLTADLYVSDGKLWRIYKDQRDSVRITSLPIWPSSIQDSSTFTDAQLSTYVSKHADEFKRPAVAFLRFVAQPRVPETADTAVARAQVARVRNELTRGTKFEDVAKRESSDTGSGKNGGDLGWVKRNENAFDPKFMAAARALQPGRLSQPVLTQFGYHLIRVDSVKGDSLKLRHILIPIALQGGHLNYVEARADTLERIAAERNDPTALDSAARRLGLPISPTYRLSQGERLTLGSYAIPDVSIWAFETSPGETSPVIEGARAYYVFRLDSVVPEGVPPLAQIRDRVRALYSVEHRRAAAKRRADSLAAALKDLPNLASAAAAKGVQVQTFGPFTRLQAPSYLAGEPVVVGASFGLRVRERSGVLAGENGYFIIESQGQKLADSTAWLAQRDNQRKQLLNAVRQARIQQYVQALRAKAKIVDRRSEFLKRQAAEAESGGL